MNNLHIIQVKYLVATNTKGSRTKLIDTRFKNSKTLSYDYSENSSLDQAETYLKSKGYDIVGHSHNEITGIYSIICNAINNSFIKLS